MRPMRRTIPVVLAIVVVLLLLGSSASVLSSGPASPSASSRAPAALAPALTTHGDLVVTSGETYTIQPTAGSHFYYQGGNITVEAGGTLDVRNMTLSFVQYITATGTVASRLSHLYYFNDFGTVNFYNSTLTTNVGVINAYAKLNVTITGSFNAWNSNLSFPGWLRVTGATASLTLNQSALTSNPAVANLDEPATLIGDTEWAPSILATAGGQVNVLGGWLNDTYADNLLANGAPGPTNLTASNILLNLAGDLTYPTLNTSNSAAALAQDWSYPGEGFGSGGVQVSYSDTNPAGENNNATVAVTYEGVTYNLGSIIFQGSLAAVDRIALTPQALAGLSASGLLAYIENTGAFGDPAGISIGMVNISGTGGLPAINMTQINFAVYPALLPYDISVSGAGTTFAAIDSTMNLTFALPPSSSTSLVTPFPWLSNQLDLDDGAVAYLANVSVSNPLPGVFSASAINPDASSQAFLYRWAQFNLTGRGGYLPIYDAHVVAHYAYPSNQSNNATVTALNDIASVSAPMWGYIQFTDQKAGFPAYASSNRHGVVQILLAAGNLTGPTLPDGYFLGQYHINVTIPVATNNSREFNWSVSPYPSGVANGTPFHGTPDFGPSLSFASYYADLTLTSYTITSNGTPTTSIDDYRLLGVNLTLTASGTAELFNLSGTFTTIGANGVPAALDSFPLENITLLPGQSTTREFTWLVNTSVTGIAGLPDHAFTAQIVYNGGVAKFGGGNVTTSVPITVTPYVANFTVSANFTANGTPLVGSVIRIGQELNVTASLSYTGAATVTSLTASLLYASPNTTAKVIGLPITLTHLALNTPGEVQTLWFNWTVNESTIGLQGKTVFEDLYLSLVWNAANIEIGGGASVTPFGLHFAPSQIRFTTFELPPSTINLGNQYYSAGALQYNGSQAAYIQLIATPVGGGIPQTIAAGTGGPNDFSLPWVSDLGSVLSPGTTYTLQANATYNGVSALYDLPGTYAVPPTSSPVSNIFFEKFLGLPLWIWLAIAAAVVAAILAFLFVARRQAAGKLVECGECGNLIPEDATVCPKCGAEFESDLIRCSRCASTIPADSKFCPECAAQLLGKPGEGGEDAERQGYADFTEKYRAEGKRELGENFNEGSFWDWWKRQPTYTSYSQWKLQQGQGTSRVGMTAPPAGSETDLTAAPPTTPGMRPPPPKGGSGGAGAAAPAGGTPPATPPPSAPAASTAPPAAAAPAAGGALKPCPNCGNEIPPEYLVCPFCGSVTQ